MDQIGKAKVALADMTISSRDIAGLGVKLNADGPRRSALDALALTDFNFEHLVELQLDVGSIPDDIQDQVKKDALYAHYIARQERDIAAMERDENHIIPDGTDYTQIKGLSNEIVAKLTATRANNNRTCGPD